MSIKTLLRATAGCAVLAVLSLVPLVILNDNEYLGRAALLSLLGCTIGCQIVVASQRRRFDLFEPIWLFLAVYAFEFWLKPMVLLSYPERYELPYLNYGESAITTAIVLSEIGLIGFYAGYYTQEKVRDLPTGPALSWPWRIARVWMILVACMGLFGVLIWYFLEKGGYDLVYMYLNRAALNRLDGDLVFAVHFVGWLIPALTFSLYIQRRKPRYLWLAAFCTIVVIAGMAIFGARMSMFLAPGGLMVLWHYLVRPIRLRAAFALAGGLFVAAALFGVFRANVDWEDVAGNRLVEHLKNDIANYAEWDVLVAIVGHYPEHRDHYYGQLAIESFYWLIPRRIWISKPEWYGPQRIQDDIVPGILSVSEEGGFIGTSLSQSTQGEGYADFGVLGVALYLFIFGLVWRGIYDFLIRHGPNLPAVVVYAPIIIFLPLSLRGFSSPLLMMLLWFVGGYVACRWFGRATPSRTMRASQPYLLSSQT